MLWLFIILGLLILVSSGDFLVRGSVALANIFKISPYIIAATFIAFGTSAPELFVSGIASYSGHPAAAVGNILGSNFANVFLALGMTALIVSISTPKNKFPLEIKILLSSTVLLLLLLYNISVINWWIGVLLLGFLFLYIIYIIKYDAEKKAESNKTENLSLPKSLTIFTLGLVGISLGANLLIEGAIELARNFGIRETVIGLGVLAFGTSLPEVATSIIAAIKKENNIAIGNIVGSNIFNILGIGGVTILLSGDDFSNLNNVIGVYDVIPFILSTLVIVYFYKFNTNINRTYGLIFVAFYIIWILSIFLN